MDGWLRYQLIVVCSVLSTERRRSRARFCGCVAFRDVPPSTTASRVCVQSDLMDWRILRDADEPGQIEDVSVLIVEDEPAIRDLWQRSLSAVGYQVTAVEDAQHALLALALFPYVALCDVHLPGSNGLWLADQIRIVSPTTAIVLATADEHIPPIESLRPGVVAYLLKPFTLQELQAAVKAGVRWSARRRTMLP